MAAKLISLAQLKESLVKANRKIAEILGAVSDAISEVNDAKADKVDVKTLTVPNTGWGTDSTVTGYTAYVDVTVSGLTANDVVVVMIAAKSGSVADAACLCGACESMAGKLRIRAKHTPTAALSAVYYIVR